MFLRKQFFIALGAIAVLSAMGLMARVFYYLACAALCLLAVAVLADLAMLLWLRVEGSRKIASKMDLGEDNAVDFRFKVTRGTMRKAYLIDEIPTEFFTPDDVHAVVRRDGVWRCHYQVLPTRRGRYDLGRALLFASCLGLLERRIVVNKSGQRVDVYPAFTRLREKDEQIRSMQALGQGQHKRQMPSNQTEFRDIREYVVGDDVRTINWKATARAGKTMVNQYEDERSQHVINVIDCGSAMHRTFNSLSLQDHAINASLLVTYSAMERESDSVGACSYGPGGVNFLPPKAGKAQFGSIMQHLYAMESDYGESDLEQLCLVVDRSMRRRSLIILYTDLPTMTVLERQLPFFKRIAARHCLLVVNCLDKDLEDVSLRRLDGAKQGKHYQMVERTLARDMVNQKQLIADTLSQHGIYNVSVYPSQLSYGVLKKYLQLKAQRAW